MISRKSTIWSFFEDDNYSSSTESDLESDKILDNVEQKTYEPNSFIKSEIDLSLSHFKSTDLKIKIPFKVRLKKLFGVYQPMSTEDFVYLVNKVYKCCLKNTRDLHKLHVRRSRGLKFLMHVIQQAQTEQINLRNVIHLTWCIMSCIHHYQCRLHLCTSGIITWKRKQDAEHCLDVNYHLIRVFPPKYLRIVLNATITFYTVGKLWDLEFICVHLILQLLQIYPNATEAIEDIIYNVEISTLTNIEDAQHLLDVLTDVLNKTKWNKFSDRLLTKFLNILICSISPTPSDHFDYKNLKKGIENSLRNIISNIERDDITKVIIHTINKIKIHADNIELTISLGNIAEYAAKIYKVKSIALPVEMGPLPFVFSLLESDDHVIILLSMRIWQNLIDRNANHKHFNTPKIFFENCKYGIVKRKCLSSDKEFFKTKRHNIYDIATKSFLLCSNRIGIENAYKCIALTLVEIPCGYSASCFVTVAICLQEYAFDLTSTDLVRSHHLHATAMSIMTLVCHIYNATVFYKYVNTVMERRAEWAPHLNPPLKPRYDYAQHHILWNKTDLFFEDYEARYGLWKCFRVKKQLI